MLRLVGLVRPLTGTMLLAIFMGLAGHLCASMITVFGGFGVLEVLDPGRGPGLAVLFGAVLVFAAVRGVLRWKCWIPAAARGWRSCLGLYWFLRRCAACCAMQSKPATTLLHLSCWH